METLRKSFAETEAWFAAVREKLAEGEFLLPEEADLGNGLMMRLLEQQQICIKMYSAEGCSSLQELEEQIQKQALAIEELRQSCANFLCIRSDDSECQSALLEKQKAIASADAEVLLKMAETGEIALYQKFYDCVVSCAVKKEDQAKLKRFFGDKLVLGLFMQQFTLDALAEIPAEEAPAAAESPVKDIAAADASAEEVPSEDVSVKDVSVAEVPVEEVPTLAPALPLENKPGSVERFLKLMNSVPSPAVRIVLPMLSQLGVSTETMMEKFCRMFGWDACVASKDEFAVQLRTALTSMEEKGLIARYVLEKGGAAYCLTRFSFESLQKQSVRERAKERFSVAIGNGRSIHVSVSDHKLIAQEAMPLLPLVDAMTLNKQVLKLTTVICKLCFGADYVQLDDKERHFGLDWKNGTYMLYGVPGSENVPCRLMDGTDAEPSKKYGLIWRQEMQPVPAQISEDKPTYWYSGDALYQWMGESWGRLWSAEEDENDVPAVDAAPADLETADAAPVEENVESEGSAAEVESSEEVPIEAESAEAEEEMPMEASVHAEAESADETPIDEAILEEAQAETESSAEAATAQEMAVRLLQKPEHIEKEQLLQLFARLIVEQRFAEADALISILAEVPAEDQSMKALSRAFKQSIGAPDSSRQYSGAELTAQMSDLPEKEGLLRKLQQTSVLANQLWAFAFPSLAFDHELYRANAGLISELPDSMRAYVQELSQLLGDELQNIAKQNDGLGFSPAVIGALVDTSKKEDKIRGLAAEASELERTPTSTVSITGLEECLKRMVGPTSSIGKALQIVKKNEQARAGEIRRCLKDELHLDDDLNITDEALIEYIDQSWSELRRTDHRTIKVAHLDNDSPAQRVCLKALTMRMYVLKQYLDIAEAKRGSHFDKLRDRYSRVHNLTLQCLAKLIEAIDADPDNSLGAMAGKSILRAMAERMSLALESKENTAERSFYFDLACTPELLLDNDGAALIIPELFKIRGLEPWIFLLYAVAAGREEPRTILEKIDNYSCEAWYQNYGSEALLRAYLKEPPIDRGSDADTGTELGRAAQRAKELERTFSSGLRLSRAYGKIREQQMETMFSVLTLVHERFFNTHNYASFRHFLAYLKKLVDEEIEQQAALREEDVRRLEEDPQYSGAPILANIRAALEKRSFVSMDSYINRLLSGEKELPEADLGFSMKDGFLAQFQACETGYYNVCRKYHGSEVSKFAEQVFLRDLGREYQHWSTTSKNERSKGIDWLKQWIRMKGGNDTPLRIRGLLAGMGFQVLSTPQKKNNSAANYELFDVSVAPTPTNQKDYRHPVPKFGTDLGDPMHIVCIYGSKSTDTLIDLLANELQLDGSTIVLMDGELTAADRHAVAAKFKADTSGQSPFLLIDRVLLLYLASLDEGKRQVAMLQCTLPFTFEVLYCDGVGAVQEEMFIGRKMEMDSLNRDQGANLVYGGRQLGKTALLTRVSNTIHEPDKQEYSFLVDVKDVGVEAFLERTYAKLKKLGLLNAPCGSIYALCEALTELYDNKTVKRLRIFVDESDKLFEELAKDNYTQIHSFVLLRDHTKGSVKFVFAGTHNVAATKKVQENNSDLLHLGAPLCIEPLSSADATDLIRRPMSYLGFDIRDQEIEMILTNTNSYPGLIHSFCSALISSVCRDYNLYYRTVQEKQNPPYVISEEQMHAVFQEKDIRKEIESRVMATVGLDDKYRLISSLLAYMIYEDQDQGIRRLYGYSAAELQAYNQKELQIPKLLEMPEQDLDALLDEMVHMGILWKNEKQQEDEELYALRQTDTTAYYRFRQQDFLNYIGSHEKVLEILLKEMEAGHADNG